MPGPRRHEPFREVAPTLRPRFGAVPVGRGVACAEHAEHRELDAVADDEQPLTKRERQKQRKQAKREAERAAQRRQRVRKLVATAVVAVLALAALGGVGFLWQQSRAERGELLAGNAEAAQAAGCGQAEEMPDLGAGHFSGQPTELAQAPPAQIYDHRPATSGQHLPIVVATGVYDQHVDERLLIHNLEHGYVVVWYSPELDEDQRAELLEWGERTVSDQPLVIVAEYPEPLPDGGQVAHTAWGYRQLCDEFNAEVADAFVDRYTNFEAPEIGVGPHDGSGDGELVPGEDTVVFPPFEGAAGQGGDQSGDESGDQSGDESGDEGGDQSGDGGG